MDKTVTVTVCFIVRVPPDTNIDSITMDIPTDLVGVQALVDGEQRGIDDATIEGYATVCCREEEGEQ